jgi:hypothetical protein
LVDPPHFSGHSKRIMDDIGVVCCACQFVLW